MIQDVYNVKMVSAQQAKLGNNYKKKHLTETFNISVVKYACVVLVYYKKQSRSC